MAGVWACVHFCRRGLHAAPRPDGASGLRRRGAIWPGPTVARTLRPCEVDTFARGNGRRLGLRSLLSARPARGASAGRCVRPTAEGGHLAWSDRSTDAPSVRGRHVRPRQWPAFGLAFTFVGAACTRRLGRTVRPAYGGGGPFGLVRP